MSDSPFGALAIRPALAALELTAAVTAAALQAWAAANPLVADAVGVAPIDPALSDTAALVEAYGLDATVCANCVVVAGRRDGLTRVAGLVIRANTRADVNGIVRRLLDVRKASFMPTADAVAASAMEYGGITPVGLPATWPVLIDRAVVDGGPAIIGSGIRRSKLTLPGAILATLPGAQVIDGLGLPAA